jgi:trk system potassium uptake protein TrkA
MVVVNFSPTLNARFLTSVRSVSIIAKPKGDRLILVHVVIMGCGRVGSSLAAELEAAGHSVAIIDQSREAFRRLGPDFKGRTVTGVGFDRDTLVEAGIETASAFAAVSNGDNSNIIAARVAREVFGVSNVVARIYDSGRAEIYQRLGIPTVATVLWATDQILRRLMPEGARSEWRDATGTINLSEVHPAADWYGSPVLRIENVTSARVAFITRLGEGLIPNEHTVLQEGDLVHVIVEEGKLAAVEAAMAKSPEES